MKKFIKILLKTIVILLLIVVCATIIALKTVKLNNYKPQIIKTVSKQLQREVYADTLALDFSFFKGASVRVDSLRLNDDPQFSQSPMLIADSLRLHVDVLAFITTQAIVINHIEIDTPEIHLIIDKDGTLNFEAFAKTVNDSVSSTESEEKETSGSSKKDKSKNFKMPPIMAKSIRISNGLVTFLDKRKDPPVNVPIADLQIEISNLSLDKPFPFKMAWSMFSDKPNIDFDGTAQIDAKNRQLRVDDVKLKSNLSDLSLSRLLNSVPDLRPVGLTDKLEGIVSLDIHQVIVGPEGLLVLTADGGLNNGKIRSADLKYPIENIDIKLEISEQDVIINEFFMYLAQGKIQIKGRVDDYMKERKLRLDINAEDLLLQELFSQEKLIEIEGLDEPLNLEGSLSSNLEIKTQAQTLEMLKSSLVGTGSLQVVDAKLININILRMVFDKVLSAPTIIAKAAGYDIIEELNRSLPSTLKEKLNSPDTNISLINTKLQTKNSRISYNLDIDGEEFVLKADGELDYKGNIQFKPTLYLEEKLSNSIVNGVSEFSSFLNDESQVEIQFSQYNGPYDKLIVYPEIDGVAKSMIFDRAKQELKDVIFKALDIREQNPELQRQKTYNRDDESGAVTTEGGAVVGDEPMQQESVSPEEAIIDDILESIPFFN